MRAKRTPLAHDAECGECIVEAKGELNEWLSVSHANPYDTRGQKVREGSGALEHDCHRLGAIYDITRRCRELSLQRRIAFAEELDGYVQECGFNPGDSGSAFAGGGGGAPDSCTKIVREVYRKKESHAANAPPRFALRNSNLERNVGKTDFARELHQTSARRGVESRPAFASRRENRHTSPRLHVEIERLFTEAAHETGDFFGVGGGHVAR